MRDAKLGHLWGELGDTGLGRAGLEVDPGDGCRESEELGLQLGPLPLHLRDLCASLETRGVEGFLG